MSTQFIVGSVVCTATIGLIAYLLVATVPDASPIRGGGTSRRHVVHPLQPGGGGGGGTNRQQPANGANESNATTTATSSDAIDV
jgi:hypothetical protein